MKFPNLTAEQCEEIINFVSENNNKRPMAIKYNLSYHMINKIITSLNGCDSLESKRDRIKEIRDRLASRGVLRINGQIDNRVNYMRYKDYYKEYNRKRYLRLKNTNKA